MLENDLEARLRKLSRKEIQRRDVFGRTVLHLVCILGRFDLLAELLKNTNLAIAVTDYESGWTALHCSIFYGKLSCAKLLLDYRYDLIKCKDRSGLTAMDLYYLQYSVQGLKILPSSIGKDGTNYVQRFDNAAEFKIESDDTIWWDKDHRGGSDVYTFGSNVNNQLGTGDSLDRTKVPYKVEIKNFRLDDEELTIAERLVKPRLKTIVLSKNHSIILTNEHSNNILISGDSSRGRLGNESSTQNFKFKHIDFFQHDHIVDVAVSDEHSLALNSTGEVFAWGLNNCYQLGFSTDKLKGKAESYSTEPKRVLHILKKYKIKGVACSRAHSAAFSDKTLILWGLNTGQMDFVSTGNQIKVGKYKGIAQIPRDTQFSHRIRQVIATNDSTIVLLENNECHILVNGSHLKFLLPVSKTLNDDFEHFKPSVFSKRKKILKLVAKDCSKIGILYNDGSVVNFGVEKSTRASSTKYVPVWTPRNSHLKCMDVDIGEDGSIIICAKSGCVFKRISKGGKTNEFKFTKLEKLSKIVKVSCDSLFASFGFIRDDIDQLPLQLKKDSFYQDIAHLSPLTPFTPDRKQSELVKFDDSNQYVTDFLHRPDFELEDEELTLFQTSFSQDDDNVEDGDTKDPLLKAYSERWRRPRDVKSTCVPLSNTEHLKLIQSEHLKYRLNTDNYLIGKGYDLRFEVDDCFIGVHSEFLFSIEKFQQLQQSSITIGEICFNRVNQEVIKVENIHLQSLLIILHFLYTGVVLKPWEKYSALDAPGLWKMVKNECSKLFEGLSIWKGLEAFRGVPILTPPDVAQFKSDVTILLRDGESVQCSSLMLRSRSAYFETLFSDRWEEENLDVLVFTHVTKTIFQVVLDYLYGKEQLSLWDDYTEIKSITEFINLQFDLIEVSDELLLFCLKDMAQLMIKDFINQENCLIILHHAEVLNCERLIGECLWFFYNNVDPLLSDPNYGELLSTQMITRIDKYCRWLNRVNKLSVHETRTAWLDGDSDILLTQFLNNDREFNDIFLESDDFVPLFDIKKENMPKSPRIMPKTDKSPSPPLSAINSTPIEKAVSALSMSSQRRPSINIGSAVDFVEEEFQPVINSRRRRSSARRASTQNSTPPLFSTSPIQSSVVPPLKSAPIPIARSSFSSRNGSATSLISGAPASLDKSFWPTIGGEYPSSSASVPKTARSGFGSDVAVIKENITLSVPGSTPPGQGIQTRSSSETVSSSAWRNNSNLKVSQKERKKLMKLELAKEEEKSASPWKIPAKPAVKPLSIAEAQEEALLVKQGIIEKGKFRDYQLNPQKATVIKSFAEIQQEQEFAAWWEEESRKVQDQMKSLNNVTGETSTSSKSKSAANGNGLINRKQKSKKKKQQFSPPSTSRNQAVP